MMKRDLNQLSSNIYDLLVIGSGIYGACIAWDAALRGLSVALVEKEDFGHATSANSLKMIHGGLRYLQDGDLKLMRMMIQERTTFLRIAPHLVHPLPCLMPTYKDLMKSKPVMAVALRINDLIGFDRNRLDDPQKHIPRGRVISRTECLRLLPDVLKEGLTGGAIWYDAQVYNTERLTLSFVLSAAQFGANVANYVEALGFLRDGASVIGVRAKDVLENEEFEIRAKVVVNAAGPWVDQLLASLNNRRPAQRFQPSLAIDLVTRQILPTYAAGLPSRYEFKNGNRIATQRSRLLFVAPWRDYSLVGTVHMPCDDCLVDEQVTESTIQDFIAEINASYPSAALKPEDIYFVHSGLLPAESVSSEGRVKLVRQSRIHDHQQEDGEKGLITVLGVKYTTARITAQRTVDLACRKLGRTLSKCMTGSTPLVGGQIEQFEGFLASALKDRPHGLGENIIRSLVYNYGSVYTRVLKYLRQHSDNHDHLYDAEEVIRAQVLHSIREEMAHKLADVIFRRTELGSAGHPGDEALHTSAAIMAVELNWPKARIQQEIEDVKAIFDPNRLETISEHPTSVEV